MMNGGTASWHANGFAIGRRLDGRFADEVRGDGNFQVPTLRVDMGNDGYLITAAIPGSEKEELTVSVEEDVLRIVGEWRPDRTVDRGRAPPAGRTFSHFVRETRLCKPVDPLACSARLENGVLRIDLPYAPFATSGGRGPCFVEVTST